MTGYPGSGKVAVHEPDGSYASTITGLDKAQGLDLSSDGATLYVAMRSGIGVIDVATRALVSTIDVAGYPTDVRQVGTRLVYLDYRGWEDYGVRTYDLTDGSTGSRGLDPGYAVLDAVDAAPNQVAVGVGVNRLRQLTLLDTSSDDPSIDQSTTVGAFSDLAFTGDGTSIVVAARDGSPSTARVYSAGDLSLLSTLPSVPGSINGLSTTALRGAIATMTSNGSGVFLRVHSLADDEPIRVAKNGAVLRNGLAFSPNGARLYVARGPDRSSNWNRLTVITSPTMTPVTLTTKTKESVPLGDPVVVTGVLKDGLGTVPEGADVVVRRTSSSGSKSLGRISPRADGSFTLRDTPSKLGRYQYQFDYAGSATRLAASSTERVEVAKYKPALRVTTDRKVYAYQGSAKVRAHLGETASNRSVTILANPARGKTVVVARGRVDANGNLVARYQLRYNTKFIAKFGGDELYQRREVSREVGTRTRISTSMRGWYGKSGDVHLYRLGEIGMLHIEVAPDVTGTWVLYQTQILVKGKWEETFWGGANIPLGKGSQDTVLVGGASLDKTTTLRCRAHVSGVPTNWSTTSGWEKFRVG
jgi:hypothetical protein